jgi:hypothetical protein
MRTKHIQLVYYFGFAFSLLLFGCSSPKQGLTNPQQPGPAVGHAVGGGVGLVIGNAAGAIVGAGEGAVAGVVVPFKSPPVSTVQDYRTTVTPDGRSTRTPIQVEVDQYGRTITPPPVMPPAAMNGTNTPPKTNPL